jgi:hypothetical protein
MEWQPYRPCCHRFAGDAEVAFCPECGHPFLRCMAFAECGSLVGPTQACPVCVAPALMIDAGAVVQSKTGERVSVPLILRNNSTGNRPIWVKQIVKLDGNVEAPVALTWEQIDPQTERHFTIETAPMAEGGTHALRMLFVIASRYRGLEEAYAFAGGTSITVSGPDTQQVIQNINLAGAQFQTGGMVHTALNTKDRGSSAPTALADRAVLPLERAERYELEHGIRGYPDKGLRVPRNVEFAFSGFRAAEVPSDGSTMIAGGRFTVGRNSRSPDPGANAAPNDICLRAYDSRTGQVDEPATLAISRHHFDFVVVNDRLGVHARTTHGMELSGVPLASGAISPLKPGERLVPIPGRPDKLTLQVAFTSSIGSVDRITISRTPGMAS